MKIKNKHKKMLFRSIWNHL